MLFNKTDTEKHNDIMMSLVSLKELTNLYFLPAVHLDFSRNCDFFVANNDIVLSNRKLKIDKFKD